MQLLKDARRLRAKLRRKDRAGLASNELIILMIVLAALALAGSVGFLVVRSVRTGSEHSVLQQNIEQVAGIADAYWAQYAADIDGRRKINLGDFCEYANTQLGGEDVNLRTLQFGTGDTLATAAELMPGADATDLVESVAAAENNGPRARCTARDVEGTTISDSNEATQEEWYADVIVFDGGSATRTPDAAAALTGPVVPAMGTRTSGAQNEQQLADALDSVAMRSTRTVWMAIYGKGAALSTPAFDFAPDGTDTTFDPVADASYGRGVEYLVLGGVAPDGASFCMLKVFDATDRTDVGNWYSARLAQDENSFTVCARGISADGDAQLARGSWPEAR